MLRGIVRLVRDRACFWSVSAMAVPRTGETSEEANTRLRAEGRRDALKAARLKYEQEGGYC